MPISIDTPAPDDFDELVEFDARAFGSTAKDFKTDAVRNGLDLDRFRVARDSDMGNAIVGVSGSFEMDLTLPGGNQIPIAGVTWVSVSPSHRRRGILRSMISAVHKDSAERGESVQALASSEGNIYERFGYGIATWTRPVKLLPRQMAFADPTPPTPGSVRVLNARTHMDEIAQRWAAYAPTQPGEVTRSRAHIEMDMSGPSGDLTVALHDDGFALWGVKGAWINGHAEFDLTLYDLAASTAEAYEALWKTVLSVDLVSSISATHIIGPDEVLPSLLADQRQVRATGLFDGVWLRVGDPVTAFGQRDYRVDDTMTLSIDGQAYRIGPNGCAVTDSAPDLTMPQASAGPLLLGGVSASRLAAGGRLTASTPEQLARADALFGWDPVAHCRTGF